MEIPLSKGQVAVIDDSDLPLISSYTWYFDPSGYAASRSKGPKVYLHRILLAAKRGDYVDHKNLNTLDNRRQNLRLCTAQQNNRNRRKSKNNSSGYTGVSWYVAGKKWRAYIVLDYRQVHLGYFTNVESAREAYDEAARAYFGEFYHEA